MERSMRIFALIIVAFLAVATAIAVVLDDTAPYPSPPLSCVEYAGVTANPACPPLH